MATYVPAKKNTAWIGYVSLVSQASTLVMQSNPTIAAGDFKVSIDGGALANLTTLPTVTPASSKMVKISLSSSEMNGDNITVVCSDAAGAEWCDLVFNIQTAARQVDDLAYPATSGRSMVVDASGLVDANAVKVGPSGSGTAQTARDLGASVLLSSGTGTGQLDFTSGVVKANVTQLLGTAWLTPGTAGTPDVNVKLWNGLTTVALPLIPTVAGRTLDVSAGGEAGLDWANVGSPTTSLALTGTTIATTQKVDVDTIKTNPVVNGGTVTFPTNATLASTTNITAGTITTVTTTTTATNLTNLPSIPANWLTAAGIAASALNGKGDWVTSTSILTALGMASGNLDGQLSTIDGDVLSALAAIGALNNITAASVWAVGSRTITGGTITAYTGNTPQTGDNFARLGAPAGASIAADIAAKQATFTTSTGVTFPTNFGSLSIDTNGRAKIQSGVPKNTALSGFGFVMVDSSDHVTGKTGLTVTATRSIDGAAFAACTNSPAEVGSGEYKIDLSAADLNGNTVVLRFTATGADTRFIEVLPTP